MLKNYAGSAANPASVLGQPLNWLGRNILQPIQEQVGKGLDLAGAALKQPVRPPTPIFNQPMGTPAELGATVKRLWNMIPGGQ